MCFMVSMLLTSLTAVSISGSPDSSLPFGKPQNVDAK